ncbi:DUF3866 family protein [Paenibacillus koleovorans]|uniref:DUF3866 family protein n=1 Tax=Paenibacillus koleovorans TaxID=121608 RepID=UPI000FDC0543|nr:DUF3866 family protein [Paenibacillus koleovorans]
MGIQLAAGTVKRIVLERDGWQELIVDVEREEECQAWHDCTAEGSVEPGDRVMLNVTAERLRLGSGGAHFVHHVIARGRTGMVAEACVESGLEAEAEATEATWGSVKIGVEREAEALAISTAAKRRESSDPAGSVIPAGGHIMKLRYTPLQRSVLAVEEAASPHHELFRRRQQLDGMPVLIGELHSMLPIAAAWLMAGDDERTAGERAACERYGGLSGISISTDYGSNTGSSNSTTGYGSSTGTSNGTTGYGSNTGTSNGTIGYGSNTGTSNSTTGYGSNTGTSNGTTGYGSSTGTSNGTTGYGSNTGTCNSTTGYGSNTGTSNSTTGYGSNTGTSNSTTGYGSSTGTSNGTTGYGSNTSASNSPTGYGSNTGSSSTGSVNAPKEPQRSKPRIAYVMSDGAALPLAYSRHAAALTACGWLCGTVTYGHAYGGSLEAVNKFTALLAARHVLRADIAIATMGPGIVGTGTRLGHTAAETAELVHAALALGGRPVLMPRLSFAEARERHRGLSAHTLTVLGELCLAPATLPLPATGLRPEEREQLERQLADYALAEMHAIPHIAGIERAAIQERMAAYSLPITTMGRSERDDPAFWAGVCAAAEFALSLLP